MNPRAPYYKEFFQIENICRHAAFDTNFKSILFRDSQLNEFIVDCTSLNLSKQINRND